MSQQLSELEQRVYHYMIDFLAANTYQPSIRDIARQFHIKSTKTVSDLLHALERKGYIERDESRSRGVRLLGFSGGGQTQPIPYYGRIHAGTPSVSPDDRKGFITVDRRFLPTNDVYFLKVKGDSMIGRGILDGDFVMVSPTLIAKDGDIIAARLADEATIKTLAHSNGRVVLEPANANERALEITPGEDFGVLGVVCGVYRPFWEQLEASPFTNGPTDGHTNGPSDGHTNGPTNGPAHVSTNGPMNGSLDD